VRLTEIRAGCAKTINLGNYQSLRVEAGAVLELHEGDDPAKARAMLQEELKTLLTETYRHQRKQAEQQPPRPADPLNESFA
jgi:hypothetical protein